MKPTYHRPNKLLGTDLEGVAMVLSGERQQELSRLWRPTKREIQRMLLDLKAYHGVCLASLGVMLGVPRITVRAWARGYREPAGSARRLIWLMWSCIKNESALTDAYSWLTFERPNKKPYAVQIANERRSPTT